jgi:2-desacetyl-2-hydroxyethyl bacteriochlorophyllide A dehydrogenase
MTETRTLWFTGPRELEIRSGPLPLPGPGQVRVATVLSAISPGTELLIYKGDAPAALSADASIAALGGSLAFPLTYGYACAGRVEQLGAGVDPVWLGRRVFAFNPHATHFVAAVEALQLIPDDIGWDDAVFLPNMESAVNFVLDGRPAIGERVVVIGQGVVGLLTTALLARMPLTRLTTVDLNPARRALGLTLGAHESLSPDAIPAGLADVCFELSGVPAALDTAITCTGYAGRVIIGSWYGSRRAPIDLGGVFHRSRIQLVSSQVSTLTPDLLARWDKPRRLQVAWEMLRVVRPARLVSHRLVLEDAAVGYRLLADGDALQVLLECGA